MRRATIGIVLTSMAIYLANGRPHAEVDCMAAPYEAWSLAQDGSQNLRRYPEMRPYVGTHVIETADGRWVSLRPPGSSLTVLPLVAPLALVREEPPRLNTMIQLGKLAAACSVAVAGACFFTVCRRLAPSAAWPATILFLFGTCLWSVASQASWMHGPATLWLCVALFYLVCKDAAACRHMFVAGLALGLAVLTRPSTALFALATGSWFLFRGRFRSLLSLMVGGMIPVGFLLLHNWSNFGHPILGGYAADNWGDAPPFWLGFGGLLIAPSRGVLIYSPALCLAPWGIRALLGEGKTTHLERASPYRNREAAAQPVRNQELSSVGGLLLAWAVAAAITLIFYARWHDWRGGWCYGPRFLCETMPILCLLFALAYASCRNSWLRRFAVGLVGLSVAVHFVGVFGYGGYAAWQERHMQHDGGRCLFELRDTQIEAHTRGVIRKLTAQDTALHEGD